MARKIQVEIVGDSRQLERAFGRSSKAASGFGRTLATVGKVGAAGFVASAVGVGLALRAGFSELAESQKVAAQTNAVLKSTGAVAGVTGKHVDKLATSISRMSGIDDEAIASAENLLLTFTQIKNRAGKNNDVFDQATKVTTDMATALGMDLNSAAMMVGKALNQMDVTAQGNVRGFMALRRVGVQITPQMMAQAKAFIAANKPMEAQKLLLRELQTEFGGSARAFGSTMPGAMGKLRNAFDELMGAFAEGFLPIILKVSNALTQKLANPAFVERVRNLGTLIGTKLYNAFALVGQWFVKHWPQIQQGFRLTGQLITKTIAGVRLLRDVFVAVSKPIAEAIRLAIVMPMRLALKLISGFIEMMSHVPFIGGKFKGAKEFVNSTREVLAEVDKGLATYARKGGPKKTRPRPPVAVGGGGPPGRGGSGPRGDVVINLDSREIARASIPHLQRAGRQSSAQTRGRLGGSNMALS